MNSSGPVFVLGGGPRTGSTLLQRLLLSTRKVLIWGEHKGVLLNHLHSIMIGIQSHLEERGGGHHQRRTFEREGFRGFVANMNPGLESFQDGCRALLNQSLGAAATQMGYRRWGFKEIRYGAGAVRLLRQLFPDCSFAMIIRDPEACLRSIKTAPWYKVGYGADPARFLRNWSVVSTELYQIHSALDRCVLLQYERFIDDPGGSIAAVAKTTDIACEDFDPVVFDDKLRGSPYPPATALDECDRAALSDPLFQSCAAALGYG